MIKKVKKTSSENNRPDKDEELLRMRQEMLAREVDEELNKERMMAFWKKYQILIIILVIAVVGAAVCYELYKAQVQKTRLIESDRFETAVVNRVSSTNDTERQKALEAFKKLGIDAKTGYKYLARLQEAGMLFDQGKTSEGLTALNAVANDKNAPDQFRGVATLSAVSFEFNTVPTEQLLARLTPYLVLGNPFYGSAAELAAALYLKENKPDEALALLRQAISDPALPQQMTERLNAYISMIESTQKEEKLQTAE